MVSQKPAIASSTELSTTSVTRWCRPRSPVEPMYIPGRLRTASRPSSTVMEPESYSVGRAPLPLLTRGSASKAGISTARTSAGSVVSTARGVGGGWLGELVGHRL